MKLGGGQNITGLMKAIRQDSPVAGNLAHVEADLGLDPDSSPS